MIWQVRGKVGEDEWNRSSGILSKKGSNWGPRDVALKCYGGDTCKSLVLGWKISYQKSGFNEKKKNRRHFVMLGDGWFSLKKCHIQKNLPKRLSMTSKWSRACEAPPSIVTFPFTKIFKTTKQLHSRGKLDDPYTFFTTKKWTRIAPMLPVSNVSSKVCIALYIFDVQYFWRTDVSLS